MVEFVGNPISNETSFLGSAIVNLLFIDPEAVLRAVHILLDIERNRNWHGTVRLLEL